MTDHDPPAVSGALSPQALKITLALLAAEVLAMIEITMIYSAMRHLVQDFGSPEAIGWTITGFLLASAVSAALFGRLGDMVDRKRLLRLDVLAQDADAQRKDRTGEALWSKARSNFRTADFAYSLSG